LSEINNSAMKNLGSMVVHLPKPNVIEHFFGFLRAALLPLRLS
jgi:hypothetical protein